MLGVLSPVPSLTLTRLVSSFEVGVRLANAYAKPYPSQIQYSESFIAISQKMLILGNLQLEVALP